MDRISVCQGATWNVFASWNRGDRRTGNVDLGLCHGQEIVLEIVDEVAGALKKLLVRFMHRRQ